MAISLTKGQKVDLTKGNAGLKTLMVGLGWDPAKKGGFFGGSKHNVDCDASVILLNDQGQVTNTRSLVFFRNLRSACESVIHSGDNLTGDGAGDDEQINIDLSRVPADVNKIVFAVNIYDCVTRKQDFGMIASAYIRVVDSAKREELLRFNLTDNYSGKTALIVGEIYRHDGEWKFAATGEGTTDTSVLRLLSRYATPDMLTQISNSFR